MATIRGTAIAIAASVSAPSRHQTRRPKNCSDNESPPGPRYLLAKLIHDGSPPKMEDCGMSPSTDYIVSPRQRSSAVKRRFGVGGHAELTCHSTPLEPIRSAKYAASAADANSTSAAGTR